MIFFFFNRSKKRLKVLYKFIFPNSTNDYFYYAFSMDTQRFSSGDIYQLASTQKFYSVCPIPIYGGVRLVSGNKTIIPERLSPALGYTTNLKIMPDRPSPTTYVPSEFPRRYEQGCSNAHVNRVPDKPLTSRSSHSSSDQSHPPRYMTYVPNEFPWWYNRGCSYAHVNRAPAKPLNSRFSPY